MQQRREADCWGSSAGGARPELRARFPISPGDVLLDGDYRIDPVAEGLNFPSSLTFDDRGRLYVAEGGFSCGDVVDEEKGRILQVSEGGRFERDSQRISPTYNLHHMPGGVVLRGRGWISRSHNAS